MERSTSSIAYRCVQGVIVRRSRPFAARSRRRAPDPRQDAVTRSPLCVHNSGSSSRATGCSAPSIGAIHSRPSANEKATEREPIATMSR